MFVRRKEAADKRLRGAGLLSHFLLGKGDIEGDPFAVTWVDIAPGARQRLHNHPQPQVYVIVAGSGLMHVAGESRQVSTGDLIYIPPNAMHGIDNNTDVTLSYISAATPAFDLTEVYDNGQLTPAAYDL
ncbi:MAG: cupin domain-containing protein [Chloroflexota bacterium]